MRVTKGQGASVRRTATLGATTVLSALLAACSAPTPAGPSMTATLKPLTEEERRNPNNVTIGDVTNIATNRKKVSCIELTLGSLHSFMLGAIADPRMVKADESTRLVAGTIGNASKQLIEDEEKCHCDRGVPMPGYELYERREHLQKSLKNPSVRPELASFYPRDEQGQPRFLRHGEAIGDNLLQSLPPVPAKARHDDCYQDCKDARARTNATARAEGKPEPWPNLEHPKKIACAAAPAEPAGGAAAKMSVVAGKGPTSRPAAAKAP